MKRTVSSILAMLTVLASMVMILPQTVSAESLYVKKIVSVVYDDSSSMFDGGLKNWAYASYAMQAFCGLLNSEDQLFVTYMSDVGSNNDNHSIDSYSPDSLSLDDKSIQGSIDSIRENYNSYGTPYNAVDIAMKKLQSVNDPDPNTQYWLVVITDGQFFDSNLVIDEKTGQAVSNADKNELNRMFTTFAEKTMPNGTHPLTNFFYIGHVFDSIADNPFVPDANTDLNIEVTQSNSGEEIMTAMREIANRVSGRSELSVDDITLLDDKKTVRVTSDVPLLNIAVLSQKTEAKVVGASLGGESALEIKRAVNFKYPEFRDRLTDDTLVGSGFLIGNGGNSISSGTYDIVFDREVSLEDFVIMFEPAIEVRPIISVNGQVLDDLSKLNELEAGDKLSVTYKIFEVGTDNEIDFDLLPDGTSCEITVTEDGKLTESAEGADAELKDYELKELATELEISVEIDGFNPITFYRLFTPAPKPVITYTVEAGFGSAERSVNIKDIAQNTDMTVVFTVFANGTAITDPAEVQALSPAVTAEPTGNSGTVTYSGDGKIVFTPNSATMSTDPSYDVTVTCTVEGVSASETYTVLISDYKVIPEDGVQAVCKTDFYGNDKGVSFYITKDDVRLDKSEIEAEGAYTALLSDPSYLSMKTELLNDGTIVCTPFAEEDYKINAGTWWIYWTHYIFDLPAGDLTVTLSHPYGSAESVLPVNNAPLNFVLLNVVLPMAIELAAAAFLIYWFIVVAFVKPRFKDNAVIYYGTITRVNDVHAVSRLKKKRLKDFNSLRWRWSPSPKPRECKIASSIVVVPGNGAQILCKQDRDWYTGNAKIATGGGGMVFFDNDGSSPEDLTARMKNGLVNIEEIVYDPDMTGNLISFKNHMALGNDPLKDVKMKVGSVMHQITGMNSKIYYIIPSKAGGIKKVGNTVHIESGTIFCYTADTVSRNTAKSKKSKKK